MYIQSSTLKDVKFIFVGSTHAAASNNEEHLFLHELLLANSGTLKLQMRTLETAFFILVSLKCLCTIKHVSKTLVCVVLPTCVKWLG